jgi:hypothetical protein
LITTSFATILREARIGEIGIGSCRHEVRTLLGEPLDWLYQEERESSGVWKYESLQFFFLSDLLTLITFNYYSPFQLPSTIHIQGYYPLSTSVVSEITEFMDENSIFYQVKTFGIDGVVDEVIVRLNNSIKLYFDETPNLVKIAIGN